MPQTQDGGTCCPANEGMEDAYFFMHEGLPMVYSDGFNHNPGANSRRLYPMPITSASSATTPCRTSCICTTSFRAAAPGRAGATRTSALFERYDYREGNSAQPQTQDVVLFGMNDQTGASADITFDDGVSRTSDGYYLNPAYTTSTAVSNSRGVGHRGGFCARLGAGATGQFLADRRSGLSEIAGAWRHHEFVRQRNPRPTPPTRRSG